MTTEQTIHSFAHLPTGWHLGRGERPSAQLIADAALYARLLNLCFEKTRAFPGADGEILLKAYQGDQRVELTFEPDQTFTLIYEVHGEDEFYKDNLSRPEMIAYLATILSEVKARAWHCMFGSSTPCITMIRMTGSSRTSHSSLNETRQGNSRYPAFLRSAPLNPAGVFANTLPSTTRNLLPNQAYIGDLTNQISQLEPA